MKFPYRTKPVSYLESQTAEVLKDVVESREPMLIVQDGEPKVVIMDARSYEEREQTLALLKILALGNVEIEQGKFRDVEAVFADLEKS